MGFVTLLELPFVLLANIFFIEYFQETWAEFIVVAPAKQSAT